MFEQYSPEEQRILNLKYPCKYPYQEIIRDRNGDVLEYILNPYPWLRPCEEYPGYYYLPRSNTYVINESGTVINVHYGNTIATTLNARGYRKIALTFRKTQYKLLHHRLVASLFIPDIRDTRDLQVNHINNISTDNRVSNLEWVTQKENLKHYYENFDERFFVKVEVKNVYTGEITIYPNRITASIMIGWGDNKDHIEHRLSKPDSRVWAPGVQIRKYNPNNKPFPVLSDIEIETQLANEGGTNKTHLRNVLTGEEYSFDSQNECGHFLKLSPGAISGYANSNQRVFICNNSIWQIKNNSSPWKLILDPYIEIEKTGEAVPVKCILPDGSFKIYLNARDCAKDNNVGVTTLNERLNHANPNKFWKDGKAYVRYKDYPGYQ